MIPRSPFLVLVLLLAGLAVAQVDARIDDATIVHLRRQIDRWRFQAVADTLAPFVARAEAERDSLRIGQLRCLEAQALLGIGRVDRSLELLEGARGIAIAQRDTLTWMTTMGVEALGLGRKGRYDEVVVVASRQIELARAARSAVSEAYAQVSLGYASLQTSRLDLAQQAYARAIDLFDEQGGGVWALTARTGAGRVASDARRFDDARRWFGEVLEEARARGDAAHEFDALNNLGAVETRLGRKGVAARYMLAAADVQARSGTDRARRITLLGNLVGEHATYLSAQRVVETLDTLEELREDAWRDGESEAWSRATLAIGTYHQRNGRKARARAAFVELMERAPSRLDRQWAGLLHASMTTDEVDAAVEFERLERLFPDPDALSPQIALSLATVQGLVASRMEQNDEALAATARGLAYVDDSPTSADLLNQRAFALAVGGRVDEAFAVFDRAIGIVEVLSDRLEGSERRWMTISNHQSWLVDTAARLLLASPEDPEHEARVFALLQHLRARSLLRELGALNGRRSVGAVDLHTVQTSLLGADEAFVDFHQGVASSVAFAVRRDRFEAVVLDTPARALGDAATLLAERVASMGDAPPSEAALRPAVDRMRRLLCGSFEELLRGATKITIAPDGRLARLPFALMFDAPVVTSVVPSIAFRQIAKSNGRPVEGPVVALAGRDPAMVGAQREVRRLARRFTDVTALSGWTENWEASMRGAAVVHVASHAEVDDERPWLSGFRLDEPVEGDEVLLRPTHLRAGDVMHSRLNAGLAVLSACASGAGHTAFGEGVIGLTSAFLIADCRAVVSTLWPVDDAVTADLMHHFYRRLAGGASVDVALEGARREVRANPSTAAPVHWAGFFVIGDGALRVALQPRGPDRRTVAVLGAGLLFVLVLLGSIRRRRISETM